MLETLTLAQDEGELVWLLALGVRFMIRGDRTDGQFSLVEHPLPARALGAPLHTHTLEDEYSYILEGQIGVQIGDTEQVAGPGTLVFKPRGIPHAFWNAGDTPARLLEIISPAGFERYFDEAAAVFAADGPPDFAKVAEIAARYQMDIDFASVPLLAEKHGLALG
ncbi:MAG TPA: cupin domain-containing protein [Nitrolancea sp.]|jgi:mannose-6-phosphate isomerase-like protein (cupin superfamily)|nr:cupin domain-containing protein [Nitrolancea sp.]